MEILILVVGTVIALIVGIKYSSYLNKNKIEMLVQRFGIKPESKQFNFDEIKILWQELKEQNYEEGIDEITWNDLEMNSIFMRINACCSSIGEQYLYKSLRDNNYSKITMKSLEEKIQYLSDNPKTRISIQKKLLQIGKKRNNYYIISFLKEINNYKLDRIWIFHILQLLLFCGAFSVIIFHNANAYALLGMMFLINISTYALMKNKYEVNLEFITAIQGILQISKKLEKEPIAGELQKHVDALKKLSHSLILVGGRYQRQSTADFVELCAIYLTGAFLFDFVLYNKALRKIQENIEDIFSVILVIGEIDMAISIASFRKSITRYCLPEFHEKHEIFYEGIYHPLLDNQVYNDFKLDTNCIITGSNASGKSTFIKAIAINEILAVSIHTCTARKAKIPQADVYTSMALRDDLLAGESYFVKEIKSLNRIIEIINHRKFVITIIDEILRGTNNKERVAASAAILKYLENKNCMVVVASHDLELVRLLENNNYKNYYFCETTEKNRILFDYKIHQGICTQQNAIKLLAAFGFPKSIVEEANNYSNNL